MAYLHYVGVENGAWQVVLLDLRTLHRRVIASRMPGITLAMGPLLYGWGRTLVWTADELDKRGRVVSRVHAYDVRTGRQRTLFTGPLHAASWNAHAVRLINARVSGQTAAFLRQTAVASDVWVVDLRTDHLRAVTRTGRASEAVITGPWVAWIALGTNALGPVMVADLRTGTVRVVTRAASYDLSAGDGLLAWDDYWTSQYTVLDLETGRRWQVPKLSPKQDTGTSVHVIGSAIVEEATKSSSDGNHATRIVPLYRVLIYANRPLPAAPPF